MRENRTVLRPHECYFPRIAPRLRLLPKKKRRLGKVISPHRAGHRGAKVRKFNRAKGWLTWKRIRLSLKNRDKGVVKSESY